MVKVSKSNPKYAMHSTCHCFFLYCDWNIGSPVSVLSLSLDSIKVTSVLGVFILQDHKLPQQKLFPFEATVHSNNDLFLNQIHVVLNQFFSSWCLFIAIICNPNASTLKLPLGFFEVCGYGYSLCQVFFFVPIFSLVPFMVWFRSPTFGSPFLFVASTFFWIGIKVSD